MEVKVCGLVWHQIPFRRYSAYNFPSLAIITCLIQSAVPSIYTPMFLPIYSSVWPSGLHLCANEK